MKQAPAPLARVSAPANEPSAKDAAPAKTDVKRDKATDLFDATVRVITELTQLMVDELACLDNRDIEGVRDLLPYKNKLVLDYNANLKAIAADPDLLKKLPEKKRDELRASGKALEKIADTNAEAFKVAVEATETIMRNVMTQVREDTKTYQTYRDLRTGARASKDPDCRPVAINKTA